MDKQLSLFISLISQYEPIGNTTEFINGKCKVALSKTGKLYIMRSKYNELLHRIKEDYGIVFINLKAKIKDCGYYIIG